MYGYPLARKLEKWWLEHGGEHDDSEFAEWLDVFDEFLAIKKQELLTEHTNFNSLGEEVLGVVLDSQPSAFWVIKVNHLQVVLSLHSG